MQPALVAFHTLRLLLPGEGTPHPPSIPASALTTPQLCGFPLPPVRETPWEEDGPVLVARGSWSPAHHLQGASHSCHQGAGAARSVGFCKRASPKGSVPSRGCLSSVPDLFVPWAQSADSLDPSPVLKAPSRPAILPCVDSQNAAVSQPRSSAVPKAGPGAASRASAVGSRFPGSPCARPAMRPPR